MFLVYFFLLLFLFHMNDIHKSSNKLNFYLAANAINLLYSILIKAHLEPLIYSELNTIKHCFI